MSENFKTGDLSVYELPGKELREMILEHANSLVECQNKVLDAIKALPKDADAEAPPEMRRKAVYEASNERLAYYEQEARFLAAHVPQDRAFMLNATQLTSFKIRWGATDVDIDKLKWAPKPGTAPDQQAERQLASTVTATPRIIMADGSMTRFLGT